jgi:hypothetical protein
MRMFEIYLLPMERALPFHLDETKPTYGTRRTTLTGDEITPDETTRANLRPQV